MTRIHPKVGWSAFMMTVYTAVLGVLAAYGYTMPSSGAAGLTAAVGALSGYLAPSPVVAAVAAPTDPPAVQDDGTDITPA